MGMVEKRVHLILDFMSEDNQGMTKRGEQTVGRIVVT